MKYGSVYCRERSETVDGEFVVLTTMHAYSSGLTASSAEDNLSGLIVRFRP